jgi:hypothetical protein
MTRTVHVTVTVTTVLLLLLVSAYAAVPSLAQPVPPNRFFGQVIVNGQPGQQTVIKAFINDVECGSARADGEGKYRLDVLSAGEKEGCGTPGAPIGFTVNGARANGVGNWQQGEFTPFDIVVGGGVFASQRVAQDQGQSNTRLIAIIVAVAAVAFVAVGAYLFMRARRNPAA